MTDFQNQPILQIYDIKNSLEIYSNISKGTLEPVVSSSLIRCENVYFENKIQGTNPDTFMLSSVAILIEEISYILKSEYNAGVHIFDAYRSRATQKGIFLDIKKGIRKANPRFDEKKIIEETMKFAADPDKPSQYPIPPHTTGAVIDLTIFDISTGNLWDMGTSFDDVSEKANTIYYENLVPQNKPDKIIKANRRILFNLMKKHHFVNYVNEWWHYGICDCIWSKTVNHNQFLPEL